ncbi:hypothetical protein B0J11DRAFT_116317 [Dendryphion nanum]|uniref:Uncharacterized protein n=1 Tax=Dendryphion nanum TaxID=256645 RepID=A0A9P9IDN3_9PLEO|nr:hypothetical protein B0J11DRAFT_116317 [Dendryphion nanum]
MADYKPPAPKVQTQDLKGKVALITGATKGIGRAIALDLATRGASILGTYSSLSSAHNFDTLSHTINDLYKTPDAPSHLRAASTPTLKGVVADITSLASIDDVLKVLDREFNGKLDILIINAAWIRPANSSQTSEEEISNSLNANLKWPITLVEKFVKQKSFNSNSRVVVISSDRLRTPRPGMALYAVSKAGLEALARTWALELPLAFPGTTSNAVSVGLTDTPFFRDFPAERQKALQNEWLPKVKVVEGGRMGYPEDVADVVGWLVSEKSRWQTGSVVSANGGSEYIGGSH